MSLPGLRGQRARGPRGAPGTVTIGSAAFPESEILAEIYAQALEREGIEVERRFTIGQREVDLVALEDGSIDLIPEYSENLLLDSDATATSSEDVYAALQEVLPPVSRCSTSRRRGTRTPPTSSGRLTTEHLIDLNTKSETDQSSAAVLAEEWLAEGDA